MNISRLLVVVLMVLGMVSPARSERVVLTSGCEITGTILKADTKVVVVDVGPTVLRLQRSDVARIIKDEPSSRPTDEEATEKKGKGWRLYRTAKLRWGSIEGKANRFGESVVMVTSPGGQGSGFIISPDGYLITNYHVIAKETRIKVTVFRRTDEGYEQKHYKKVRIIALNPFVDLALLKIEETKDTFAYAYLGDVATVEVGNPVFAIGNPLGLTRTVSQGIVSTKNRNFGGQLYIQTTADLNPGNSGGPLFNLKGEVIGVTSMGYIYFGGLNFAIPSDVVKRFVENRDAFAYDQDNPNAGYRYLQPGTRQNKEKPPPGKLPGPDRTQTPRKGGESAK